MTRVERAVEMMMWRWAVREELSSHVCSFWSMLASRFGRKLAYLPFSSYHSYAIAYSAVHLWSLVKLISWFMERSVTADT